MTILPSPIPHPLDFTPWEMPGWVYEALEWVVGFDWPEGNEKTTWDIADQWYDLVSAMAPPQQDAADAAQRVIAAYGGSGVTVDAFIEAWQAVAEGSDAPLNALLEFGTEMGKIVEECGADIEGAKLEAWIEIGLFVIELIGLAVTVVLTLGAASPAAAGIIAATRMAIQQIFKRLIAQLAKKAVKQTVKDLGKRVAKDLATKKGLKKLALKNAKEGFDEGREEFLTELAIQSYQSSSGRRDGLDAGDLWTSATAGAAGGVAAGGAMIGAGRRSGMVRGAASEVLGELGGAAATGRMPSFEELAKSASSGASGSAVDGVKHDFQDIKAGGDLTLDGDLPAASTSAGSSSSPSAAPVSFAASDSSPVSPGGSGSAPVSFAASDSSSVSPGGSGSAPVSSASSSSSPGSSVASDISPGAAAVPGTVYASDSSGSPASVAGPGTGASAASTSGTVYAAASYSDTGTTLSSVAPVVDAPGVGAAGSSSAAALADVERLEPAVPQEIGRLVDGQARPAGAAGLVGLVQDIGEDQQLGVAFGAAGAGGRRDRAEQARDHRMMVQVLVALGAAGAEQPVAEGEMRGHRRAHPPVCLAAQLGHRVGGLVPADGDVAAPAVPLVELTRRARRPVREPAGLAVDDGGHVRARLGARAGRQQHADRITEGQLVDVRSARVAAKQ